MDFSLGISDIPASKWSFLYHHHYYRLSLWWDIGKDNKQIDNFTCISMLRITIAKGIEKDDIDSYGEYISIFAVIIAEKR